MAAGSQWAAQLRWPGQLVFLILGFIPLWQSQNSIRASPEHEDSKPYFNDMFADVLLTKSTQTQDVCGKGLHTRVWKSEREDWKIQ